MATHIITRTATSSSVSSSTLGKGSALSHSELDSNFINLRDGKLDIVSDDFTGELSIKGSGGSATGAVRLYDNDDSNYLDIKAPATIGANYVLTFPANDGDNGEVLTTNGLGVLTWTDKTVDTTNLVSDTSPQLGGDLDVNGNDLVTTSNGNIKLTPNGTGQIRIDSNVIEQHSAAGLVINHLGQGTHNGANFGAPEGDSTGSTMLFNTGVQIEGRGQYQYPAIVLRNNSINGYNNLWAAKARPSGGSNYTTDDFLDEDEIIFRFFGAGYQGTDGAGNSVFSYGSATIDLFATENHSSSTNGGGIRFKTLDNGVDAANNADTQKMVINDDVVINKAFAAATGTSYSAGIPGTVTFGTFSSSDTTPSVAAGNLWKTHTSTQALTDFDDGIAGQFLTIISTGAVTYDVTSSGLKGGTTDIITAAGDVTTWVYDGTDWYLTSFVDQSADHTGGL